jgi:uncharacterized oligopeptide transporter (OPT) family protein
MAVRKSVYRQPVTPEGMRKIESGELKWFDTEMFANFNTGLLEQYLDEKNRVESFKKPAWDRRKIIYGLCLGCLFALINQYVGLKVGMVIAGSMYIIYLTGMAFRWDPAEINLVSTTSNGAAMICTGFVFSFPAIYILAYTSYGIIPQTGENVITEVPMLVILIAAIAAMLAGILGTMYFIIFRRIWLVEDPLPMPGFEANVKMMDMARTVTGEEAVHAKRSIKVAFSWISATAFFTFLRDFPLTLKGSILDHIFGGKYYDAGTIMQPMETAKYTHLSITLIPMQFGIGWFMKFRTALIIFLGTAFTWFVVIPVAVGMHAPIYDALLSKDLGRITFVDVSTYPMTPEENPAWHAYDIARVMAIGVILGGGFTALFKMAPVFKTVTADLFRKPPTAEDVRKGKGRFKSSYEPRRGWYEWPPGHIKIMAIITFIAVGFIFALGYPQYWYVGFILSGLLVGTTFLLGAIAVKVMGETGTEPVSATSFIVLLVLIVVLKFLLHLPDHLTVIIGLIGATVFGSAISMSGDIVMDFKNGIYCGNRPATLVRGLTTGIIPGAIISAAAAALLSYGLAIGKLDLKAPQAYAFSLFTMIMITGNVQWSVFILGIGIGVFMELLIGMGTAFGLGMYLPLCIQVPMLLGGALRDLWEKKWLEPRAKAEKWTEKQRTLKLLDTYLMATGLIIGEALMGTIVAIYLVLPLFVGGG